MGWPTMEAPPGVKPGWISYLFYPDDSGLGIAGSMWQQRSGSLRLTGPLLALKKQLPRGSFIRRWRWMSTRLPGHLKKEPGFEGKWTFEAEQE